MTEVPAGRTEFMRHYAEMKFWRRRYYARDLKKWLFNKLGFRGYGRLKQIVYRISGHAL